VHAHSTNVASLGSKVSRKPSALCEYYTDEASNVPLLSPLWQFTDLIQFVHGSGANSTQVTTYLYRQQ